MNHILNKYRNKKFGNKYLLTTEQGNYCIVSEKEFNDLKLNQMDGNLVLKLLKKDILLNKNNIGNVLRVSKERYNQIHSGTSLHIIVVTLRCNMSCVYCQVGSKHTNDETFDMNKETAKKTVDLIFQTPSPSITIEFQGGEPLLNWDTVKFITEYSLKKNSIHRKNLSFVMVTNMTLMNEYKMNYLIENNFNICTSLDGFEELHNTNRKNNGNNHRQVMSWIKSFNKEYKLRGITSTSPYALVTLTRGSLKHPKEIVDEYVKAGLTGIHLRYLNKMGTATANWKDINYSAEEYLKFWNEAVNYIEELRKNNVNINERMIEIMLSKLNEETDPNYMDLRSPCGVAIGQLAYNYDGNVYSCDEARMMGNKKFLLGDINNTYDEIIKCTNACDVIKASINNQYECDKCVYQPYCGVCPVCNYSDYGDMNIAVSKTNRCKIFKAQFDWVVANKIMGSES